MIKLDDKNELIIDEQYHNKVKQYKWHIHTGHTGNKYLYTFIKGYKCGFYNVILDIDKSMAVIHKNGNWLDFRKANLIICQKAEYRYITGGSVDKCSKYIGVYKKDGQKQWWVFKPDKHYKNVYEGKYETEEEAAIVVDHFLYNKYGDIALRNFPALSGEELQARFEQVRQKYGHNHKERSSKGRQKAKRDTKANTSKYTGVYYFKRTGKWQAYINYMKKRSHLGYYDTEESAAKAYDKKALELYGKDAKLNFPIT
ncbi:MAG: AP2/ERF family transcription factor [Firmicutes bacterium]|nr:AP2/ERF family transcription factor [Bacillota bacterium]